MKLSEKIAKEFSPDPWSPVLLHLEANAWPSALGQTVGSRASEAACPSGMNGYVTAIEDLMVVSVRAVRCEPLLPTTSPPARGRSDSPVYTNLQELKLSGSGLPPVPSSSPLHVLGDWETHKDLGGRHFYYNRASGERTWKPPRSRDAGGSGSSRGDSQTAESEVRLRERGREGERAR
ncbi:Rho GTPase-activating protein 12 [Liparis tanakae]|uniref:Rho GTPase-activating protein 12 n=1 Tax=Liparis tanakae TaxID=230148 RepID=A0A4Z2E8Z0_9TELE|nr:Rho GTPase-activating protein 12 [Liparis tanakae]